MDQLALLAEQGIQELRSQMIDDKLSVLAVKRDFELLQVRINGMEKLIAHRESSIRSMETSIDSLNTGTEEGKREDMAGVPKCQSRQDPKGSTSDYHERLDTRASHTVSTPTLTESLLATNPKAPLDIQTGIDQKESHTSASTNTIHSYGPPTSPDTTQVSETFFLNLSVSDPVDEAVAMVLRWWSDESMKSRMLQHQVSELGKTLQESERQISAVQSQEQCNEGHIQMLQERMRGFHGRIPHTG